MASPETTAFQWDVMASIAKHEDDHEAPPKGSDLMDTLDPLYKHGANYGRLYPNLDELADRGLIEKRVGVPDDRSNTYTLTERGREALEERARWLNPGDT